MWLIVNNCVFFFASQIRKVVTSRNKGATRGATKEATKGVTREITRAATRGATNEVATEIKTKATIELGTRGFQSRHLN